MMLRDTTIVKLTSRPAAGEALRGTAAGGERDLVNGTAGRRRRGRAVGERGLKTHAAGRRRRGMLPLPCGRPRTTKRKLSVDMVY